MAKVFMNREMTIELNTAVLFEYWAQNSVLKKSTWEQIDLQGKLLGRANMWGVGLKHLL